MRQLRLGEAAKCVSTPDDWAPCFPEQSVIVKLVRLHPEGWRVLVSGADDDVLEHDFPNREVAVMFYDSIYDGVTHADLLRRGFRRG